MLVALKLIVDAWILRQGFTHVSDDDYSRTTISELFAKTPRLDPSGTSWLPLPFWVEGGILMLFGRSLSMARAVAIALGAACIVLPRTAMRVAGMRRRVALVATATVLVLPWNAWLGVATVPDGWTGALAAAAVIGALTDPSHRTAWAAALLAAALSRYETWPACAVVAAFLFTDGARAGRLRKALLPIALCAAGPVAWMAWNAHAHGSLVHFLTRVSAFRRASGGAAVPLSQKLFGYPRALWADTPEVVVLGVLALLGFGLVPELRKRWGRATLVAGAVLLFLVAGDVGDGAPTHHPARALVMTWWILAPAGIEAIGNLVHRLPRWGRPFRSATVSALCAGAIAWCIALPTRWAASPGRTPWDDRRPQIARGLDLRERRVSGVTIVPCQFEHFALLAAWGQPERAVLLPRSGAPPGPECPWVQESDKPR
ncbi:MAG: hypothetical protein ABTD50_08505 [Polyangiaceae bacterium]